MQQKRIRLEREAPPLSDAANGHTIACHIPLEELRRVESVFAASEGAAARP